MLATDGATANRVLMTDMGVSVGFLASVCLLAHPTAGVLALVTPSSSSSRSPTSRASTRAVPAICLVPRRPPDPVRLPQGALTGASRALGELIGAERCAEHLVRLLALSVSSVGHIAVASDLLVALAPDLRAPALAAPRAPWARNALSFETRTALEAACRRRGQAVVEITQGADGLLLGAHRPGEPGGEWRADGDPAILLERLGGALTRARRLKQPSADHRAALADFPDAELVVVAPGTVSPEWFWERLAAGVARPATRALFPAGPDDDVAHPELATAVALGLNLVVVALGREPGRCSSLAAAALGACGEARCVAPREVGEAVATASGVVVIGVEPTRRRRRLTPPLPSPVATIVDQVGASPVVSCGAEWPAADLSRPAEAGVLGASAAGKRPSEVAVAVLDRAEDLAWAVNGLFDASFDRSNLVVVLPAPTDPTGSQALEGVVAAADLTHVAVAAAALTARPALVVVGAPAEVVHRRTDVPVPPPPPRPRSTTWWPALPPPWGPRRRAPAGAGRWCRRRDDHANDGHVRRPRRLPHRPTRPVGSPLGDGGGDDGRPGGPRGLLEPGWAVPRGQANARGDGRP